jgi:mRNA interferase MazF
MGAEPLRIRLAATAGLRKDFDLLLDQMRAIDNRRLIGVPLFNVPAPVMKRVAKALGELLALDE